MRRGLFLQHTHTHPFNSPLSGTTQVSRYQKCKTSLDFTEARDSKWQWHQLGHMQVCISLQTDNHASTLPLSFFYRPDALPATQPHTHTRLMALCPGLPGWAGTRKVKPIWILLKQETVSGRGIRWATCKSALRSRQITTPAPHRSVFTGRMPFLSPNQQCQSTEGTLFRRHPLSEIESDNGKGDSIPTNDWTWCIRQKQLGTTGISTTKGVQNRTKSVTNYTFKMLRCLLFISGLRVCDEGEFFCAELRKTWVY